MVSTAHIEAAHSDRAASTSKKDGLAAPSAPSEDTRSPSQKMTKSPSPLTGSNR